MKLLVLIILSAVSVGIYGQDLPAQALSNTLGVEIKWTGFVQGVGFRAYVKKQATEYKKVFGWVANQNDGSVNAYAEADEIVLKAFVKAVLYGPDSGNVEKLEINFIKPKGHFDSFTMID